MKSFFFFLHTLSKTRFPSLLFGCFLKLKKKLLKKNDSNHSKIKKRQKKRKKRRSLNVW